MKKVHTDDKYDYFLGQQFTNNPIYNIKPKGTESCNSGYYDVTYIERMKGVKFPNEFKSNR